MPFQGCEHQKGKRFPNQSHTNSHFHSLASKICFWTPFFENHQKHDAYNQYKTQKVGACIFANAMYPKYNAYL